MPFRDYPESEREAVIGEFNARFADMERALRCLSVHCREGLLAGESSPVLETFVWTVKSWWSVRGPRKETKAPMARALASLTTWSPALFEPGTDYGPGGAEEAYQWVNELVRRSRSFGVHRREYSWASKLLHWIMPGRVPAFDSFVRDFLRIHKGSDLPEAYRQATIGAFEEMARITRGESHWVDRLELGLSLRTIDKFMWSKGGGDVSNSPVIDDPCKVLRQLSLNCVIGQCEIGRRRQVQPGYPAAP